MIFLKIKVNGCNLIHLISTYNLKGELPYFTYIVKEKIEI